MPRIINILKYLPIKIDASIFGGRITHDLYMSGLTRKEFGSLIPADSSTIREWENGKYIPSKKKRIIIEATLTIV
jgi:ribosome-binding protein aMBF1 (putative translation factor)